MSTKTLDEKITRILADSSCNDFIIADAKDADMSAGMASPGMQFGHAEDDEEFRSMDQYRSLIRENVEQGLIDIMLMSSSTSSVLVHEENIFENSAVTPAVRLNDATDIWAIRGSFYQNQPSTPFSTATVDQAMCGKVSCTDEERAAGVNLGLYSVTFNNKLSLDLATTNAYQKFRQEAEAKGMRHFLEVFNPNALQGGIENVGSYVNDCIARTLAGVAKKGQPIFLKIAYNGPAALEELCSYDSSLIVGILGGSSGTTMDAFHQLWEAKNYGARVALYGRMINNSEHQPTFIKHLRELANGNFRDPAEAVMSYHSELKKQSFVAFRKLEDDLVLTSRI